jgi:hypothetical protein
VLLQGALLSQFLPQPLRLASVTVALPAAASQPNGAAPAAAAAADTAADVPAGGPGAAPAAADADATGAAAAGTAQAAAAKAAAAMLAHDGSGSKLLPSAAVKQAVQRALHGRLAPLFAAAAPTGPPEAYRVQRPLRLAVHVVPAAPLALGLQPSPTRQSPSGALTPGMHQAAMLY